MLTTSDRPIENIIEILAKNGVEAGYLVPTSTGLDKSILDAHASLRSYFKSTNFHDYESQGQGSSGKKILKGVFLTSEGLHPTDVSLYRPTSKTGDPRIWIYGLKELVAAGNLLTLFTHNNVLYIVNASDRRSISDDGVLCSPLLNLIVEIVRDSDFISLELLDKLKGIANHGWISSLRNGPTGIGFTLESLLGITANSSKSPDYKGIEIKSSRSSGGKSSSRITLFSKTPNWNLSPIKNGLGLLDSYGYKAQNDRLQLYCSLSNQPNTLGHFLEVQNDEVILHSKHLSSSGLVNNVLLWDMDQLRSSLSNKHKETFWVKAKVRRAPNGVEQFLYTDVIHTKKPLLSNMVEMLRLGRIELDYVIHEEFNKNGKRKSRDHGYLFKMWDENIINLFPPPRHYSLL
jgi:hypothetical protein